MKFVFRRMAKVVPVLLASLLGLLDVRVVRSEPPTWQDIQQGIFVTSRQCKDINPEQDFNNGIWRLDSVDGSWLRLRPFYSSRAIWGWGHAFDGGDGRLSAEGDRLVYQSWPYDLVFDAGSWRLVNRVPILNPGESLGWALQGPRLTEEQVADTGLVPGRYGFAQCILDDVSNVHLWGPRPCDPLQLPDGLGFIGASDGTFLFSDGDKPPNLGNLENHYTFTPQWFPEAHVLSFDRGRGGFWRTDDEGSSFFPVFDGLLKGSTIRLQFDFEPFDGDDGAMISSLYHPPSGRLFSFGAELSGAGFYREGFLFSVDPVTSDRTDYTLPVLSEVDFYPVSMTSFEELPTDLEQLVPIIAETPGRNGTFWTTDVWLFNPSGESQNVELSRIATPNQVKTVTLPPYGSLSISNALAWAGGGSSGDGSTHDALRVVSDTRWGRQLVVAGRIWTADPDTGGSFGHAVTAVPYPWGYSNHGHLLREDDTLYNVLSSHITVSHVDLDFRESGRFRHNLGLVNSTDESLSIDLLWGYNESEYLTFKEKHPDEWRQTVTVAPHSVKVVDIKSLFPMEITDIWPPRLAVLGETPLPLWISMVDELTGDATFVPFSNFAPVSRTPAWDGGEDPLYRLVLPVAAHTRGRNGSRWVTDLIGFMGGGSGQVDVVSPYFHPSDREVSCGGGIQADSLYINQLFAEFPSDLAVWTEELIRLGLPYDPQYYATGGWRTIFPDIVHAFDPCVDDDDVFGGLELVTGSWFGGFSRTYTTRSDGGTFGSMMPLYPPGGWPVQHFAGLTVSDATRINVGFFNGDHENPVTHHLTLYAVDGSVAAEKEFVLESLGSRLGPIETLFGIHIPDGVYGLTVMPQVDSDPDVEGRSWAYVSVIDQETNDPTNFW